MKPLSLLLPLLLFLCSNPSTAQSVNFEDGFEDGDFTDNPSWSGDTGDFTVTHDNPNYLLQLDAASAGPSYLSAPSSKVSGKWKFYIKFRNFEPSGSNRAEIFLMSDIANLEGAVNGYAVQVGESGNDVFRLVRYDNGTEAATILSGTTIVQADTGYTVQIIRDDSGSWQMDVDPGYGLFSPVTSNGMDNTYTAGAYFGPRISFTSTRSDLFYLDFKIDLPPFTIYGAQPADNSSVDIAFNRAVDKNSVQVTDFLLNNGSSSPSSLSFPARDTVRLHYDEALVSNKYSISVSGVSDLAGNAIKSGASKTFIVYDTYAEGDIRINEFAYDPPVGLEEYVELINTSNKYIDIANWEVGDANSTTVLGEESITLEPDSFLVISPDTAALFNTFGQASYYKFSKLPAFNNSGGDIVRLLTETGFIADSLFYTSEWGGTNIALERRSATAPGIYRENWGDSPHSEGGTPGFANEVSTDRVPPFFEELHPVDATQLQLVFSERITSASATDRQNYRISPGKNIQLIAADKDSVRLILSEKLTSEVSYEVTASNISDIFGNTLSGATRETTFLHIGEAKPGDIVINEILYNPNSKQADFIELFNASDNNFDLGYWLLGDSTDETHISSNTLLRSHEHLVLTGSDLFASSINNAVDVDNFPALNNTGDVVYLKTEEERIIDSLRYSPDWAGNKEGISLERIDPEGASNDSSNWRNSSAAGGITAGTQNAVFHEDISPPEIIFSKELSDALFEIYFNEFIRLTDDVRFLVDGKQLTVAKFDSSNANTIALESPPAKGTAANEKTITVQNLSDVKGNIASLSEISVSQPPEPGALVINEIMFDPLDDPDDYRADQGEYIELRNTGDYAVSLEGLVLHDAPDEQGKAHKLPPLTTTAKWVPAKGHVLIYADTAGTFDNSRVANFFDLEAVDQRSVMRVDRSGLNLSSRNDAIYIADSSGTTIDSVYYNENWHNSNVIDTRGIALERVSPKGPGNQKSNWSSSVNEKGGTPARENSIYQKTIKGPQNTGISFTPNPFSPDDDGYEDKLLINYKLGERDYLIKVRIYDRYGRLVRKLADGKQAGFEGQLIWDGRKDDGSRNRIGIYIIVFEAYDSANGRNRSFKKTVVLARKLN